MTMKIGDKEIVFVRTFIIGKGEELQFSFSPTHPDDYPGMVSYGKVTVDVKVNISDAKGVISANWRTEINHQILSLTLPDLAGSVGATIGSKPLKTGEIANKTLAVIIAGSGGIEGSNIYTFQFVFGGTYE